MKIPSIHWRVPEGSREPEKRAGMIGTHGDEDYKNFFKIAEQYEFRIIFDGLGIKERSDTCFSHP